MKRNALGFFLALAFLSLFNIPAHAETDKYYIPPSQMNVAFQVMDRGMSNIFGMFQTGTGAFSFDEGAKTISNVRLAIDTTSMMVPNQSAWQDLRNLFATRQYPEISFMATAPAEFKDGKAEIKGTLKIHGQSKATTFDGTLNNVSNKKGDDASIGLSLRGSFKREDFGMGDEPEIPGRFGDTFMLLIETQAIRQ